MAAATPVVIPVPGLLGVYDRSTPSRTEIASVHAGSTGLHEVSLLLTVTSLCDDPSCDVLVGSPGALRSGPLRGTSEIRFSLPQLWIPGSLLLPVGLTLHQPFPGTEPPAAAEDCDAGGRRESCQEGSITYNGFWGAAVALPTLESPARVTAASIVVRRVPEPRALALFLGGAFAFRWRVRRHATAH